MTERKFDAVQFAAANFDEVEKFVDADVEWRNGRLIVPTRKGPIFVLPGQWIVRVGDELRVGKPGEFGE